MHALMCKQQKTRPKSRRHKSKELPDQAPRLEGAAQDLYKSMLSTELLIVRHGKGNADDLG